LPQLASYTNAGYSATSDMSPYKVVYGRDYPLISTYRTAATSVPAADDYCNRHNKLRNSAYQALSLARIRSIRTVTKGRTPRPPVPGGREVLFCGDKSTESGRLKKLDSGWSGPFTVLNCDEIIQNYIVNMGARMYLQRETVFHYLGVKPNKENDDEPFPGQANINPAAILINEKPEWEVEAMMDYREHDRTGQSLVK